MSTLLSDLNVAFRGLRRAPGFALAAILTLALGVGANTAVFSVVNGVLLRPLPYPAPERVVYVAWDWGTNESVLSPLKYRFAKEHARSFVGVSATRGRSALLGGGDRPADVRGILVDDDFFDVFATRPLLGRAFSEDEYVEGGGSVVVLGHDAWRAHFAGDPGVVGRSVTIEGEPYTVVGVMPPGFRYLESSGYDDFLIPYRLRVDPDDIGHNHLAVARLRDGVTHEQASAELAALSVRLREEHPAHVESESRASNRFVLSDYATIFVGDLGRTLWILLGAVAFVLLIACANVANLMLVRASERHREIAVRAALGAGRGRIVRQLVTESLTLACIAGVIGVTVGVWTVDAVVALVPGALPRIDGVTIDARVLAAALAVTLATGVVFGLAGAVPLLRSDLTSFLRAGGRGGDASVAARRVRGALVVAETAFASLLLAGAGLLIASFLRLTDVDPGFRTDGIVAASFGRMPPGMDAPQVWRLQETALGALRRQPSIAAAATTASLPLERGMNIPITVVGRPDATEGAVEWRAVSDGYFDVLDVPLIAGRTIGTGDRAGGEPVIVVNAAFAERYFGAASPIGEQLAVGAYQGEAIPGFSDAPRTIVGVVADVREIGLDAPPRRTVYVPQSQVPSSMASAPSFLLRTGAPDRAIADARDVFAAADPRLPAPRFRPLREVVAASLAARRFNTLLMTAFAAVALALTAVGLYGVLAFGVRQRTREIGIRMALGAGRPQVLRMVVGRGLALTGIGLALGLAGALAVTRTLQGLLFGVAATDPATYALVAALLVAIAALASYLPARRALAVPPVVALREE